MPSRKISLSEFPSPGARYSLEDCLGCGNFGKVFVASDAQAGHKKVAIKIQKLASNIETFILQEYRVLLELSHHPNLPDFYGIYRKEDDLWLVMELCEGGTVIDLVRGLLAQNRRMAEEHIAYVLKEIVKAVVFLHENRIIHRDIKAKNILLSKEGEVKLSDFGFSASLKDAMDKTGTCIGSPCWMAPEIIANQRTGGNYDSRCDVWALGITAIELGDGAAPYESMHATRALFQIVTNPPPTPSKPSNWSENYCDFVNECLVKNPEHRPYMVEVIDHPFLTQIPDNNYHLTLEIKSLIHDYKRSNHSKECQEVSIVGKFLRCDPDSESEIMHVEDLASLDAISEANILKELEARLKKGENQTFLGDILLSLNMNKRNDFFGDECHIKYSSKSRSDNAPHIYAVADSAYQNALHHAVPQRVVLAGESGSGKTRNYLHLIDHLLFLGQNKNVNVDRLKGAIKLIHSFTHASTPINNYSTRCVFQSDIKYGSTGKVSGALFNVQQLEKWRVSSVDMFQGNFHILYYIYDGLAENKKLDQYRLNADRGYRYLRVGDDSKTGGPKYNIGKNLGKFKKIMRIFEDFQLSESEMDGVFALIAAVLTIGEIRFGQCDDDGAKIENQEYIERVGEQLKIDPSKFSWALTNYCLVRKGAAIRRRSTVDEARDARDVLANTIYTRLVDYMVALINHKLASGRAIFGEKYSIKIFDYFGFECFKTNHLPQLMINCLNEQLQYHYLQRVFSWEYMDAKEEELEFQPIQYYDNKITLDQLLSKSEGILTLIDEASKSGRNGKHVIDFFQRVQGGRVKVCGNSEFSVAHYTGKVIYDITEMPDKNRDFLPPEIIETLRLSDSLLVKQLFTNKLNKFGNLIISFDADNETNKHRYKFSHTKEKINHQYSQIKRIRTYAQIYKASSLDLLKELSIGSGSGSTHFVRCIRTQIKGQTSTFNHELIKQQLRALAIVETAKERQSGFPHRVSFPEFLQRYQFLAFDFNENVEVNRDNCRLLLIRLKMEGWAIGKSKVFLKYYHEEYLARLYETQVKKIIKIQSILRRFLAKCSVAKKLQSQENQCVLKLKKEGRNMTEEEAAAIIQKAYRETTIRKAYPDFAKDYVVLDDTTCDFIRPFTRKWRSNSLFYVLLQYRAMRLQDFFNFAQQVHFYNIAVFYDLQQINQNIEWHCVDSKAQASHWLGEAKPSILKVPFHLDDIPFYDTSSMCTFLTNPGTSGEKDDSWDMPYRWRELVCSKTLEFNEEPKKPDEVLTNLPYTREETIPIIEVTESCDIEVKEIPQERPIEPPPSISKEVKDEENKAVQKRITNDVIQSYENKLSNQIIAPKLRKIKKETPPEDCDVINSNTKSANDDFDYIRSPKVIKPKAADPVAELRRIARKNSADEDDPPFNFQGMLRKTNFRRGSITRVVDEIHNIKEGKINGKETPPHEEEKELEKLVNGINDFAEKLLGKEVKLELAPGLFLEGIEFEL